MIDSYLRYLEYEKRYSRHTLTAYKTDLQQFATFLGAYETLPEKADYRLIRLWVISLVEDGLHPQSVNRKIASLRSFYKFLLRKQAIDKDPTAPLQALKTPRNLPVFVQEKDLDRLFDHYEFSDDFAGLRDRLILELLYGTGMRRAELLGLTDEAIDKTRRQIKVLGKRNKERIIPVSAGLVELIGKYIQERNKTFGRLPHNKLIVTDKGAPAYPVLVYRTVVRYLGSVVSLDKKSPHILRHSYATHLLNNGADLNAVKDLLGHASLAATQVYTHNSLEKLKKVFKQAHPKA